MEIKKLSEVCILNRFSELDANSLSELNVGHGDVKLLPSSKDYDWFSTEELCGNYVCDGEVITLGRARYANIKYWRGKFVSANNVVIETYDSNKLLCKYLYYFLLFNTRKFYVEGTTYPKFDVTIFKATNIVIPSIDEQKNIVLLFDNLFKSVSTDELIISKITELKFAHFIEMFGDPITNNMQLPLKQLGDISLLKSGRAIQTGELVDIDNGLLFPCFGGNGLRGYINRYSHEGDFPIIGRQGALAGNINFAHGKFYATEHAVVATPIVPMNTVWYYYALVLIDLKRFQSGAAQPGLAVSKINSIVVPFPNLASQNLFASFIKRADKLANVILARINSKKELIDKKLIEFFGDN